MTELCLKFIHVVKFIACHPPQLAQFHSSYDKPGQGVNMIMMKRCHWADKMTYFERDMVGLNMYQKQLLAYETERVYLCNIMYNR